MTAEIPLSPDVGEVVRRLGVEPPEQVTRLVLVLEGVVAEDMTGDYEIYLNYPEATLQTLGEVPNFVGLLAGFGADHRHANANEDHADHGVGARYELTALVAYLVENREWNDDVATVTFVPAPEVESATELAIGPMRVGRVGIRAEEGPP